MAMSLSLWMRITFAISSSVSHSWTPVRISFTRRWIRFWYEIGACLNQSACTSENLGALWDGIRAMNCENSRNVVTGLRIVSPGVIVRKSNVPALTHHKPKPLLQACFLHSHGYTTERWNQGCLDLCSDTDTWDYCCSAFWLSPQRQSMPQEREAPYRKM